MLDFLNFDGLRTFYRKLKEKFLSKSDASSTYATKKAAYNSVLGRFNFYRRENLFMQKAKGRID